ncbi:MAG TPA: nucleoside monophosphate kinase [Candidatus Bathyarchaeia archaeon]|nr:nucleoside monophosphate kinase [Candidatus Bathyarchaeia archaeon]
MNLIVLGPQGSGKGTQAEMLAKKYNLEHIDMGKSLREVAKQDTPLGKEIYHIQNVTNTLVPSRILREVLHLKINSIPREQGILFEGVPRTSDQQGYLEEEIQNSGRKIDNVVFISIPEEETMKRIGKRWICKKNQHMLIMGKDIRSEHDKCPIDGSEIFQRIDDTPAGIKKRLQVNREETIPVVEDYRKRGLLIEIDGTPSIEKVSKNIIAELEKKGIA